MMDADFLDVHDMFGGSHRIYRDHYDYSEWIEPILTVFMRDGRTIAFDEMESARVKRFYEIE